MGSGTICTLELEKVHCHPGSIQPEKVNRNSTGPKKDVALACVHTFGYIWAVVVHDNNAEQVGVCLQPIFRRLRVSICEKIGTLKRA